MLAILLPLTGYWIVKYYSKDAVRIPPHYFYDSVGVSDGKPDTTWHKIKSINFTNQFGKKVSLDDLHGKIIVMDFFFTRCPSICPGLAKNMKRLQDSFTKNDSIVQFVSITVDPVHDSVDQLRKFADRFNVNHDSWWFLTGDRKEIYDFALNEIRANIADVNVDTAFVHTENFFLIDTNHVVRGWYNGFDSAKQKQLVEDIPTLLLERNRKSPSILREFIPYLPVIFIGIGIVIFAMAYMSNKKKRN
jgi:protein SCO1/2